MKLYELKRLSCFNIVGDADKGLYYLHHVDGMFSVCSDPTGEPIHLSVMTEVVAVTTSEEEYEDAVNLSQFIDIVGIEHA